MDFQRVQHHSSSIQVPSSKIQVPFKFLSSSIQTRCVSVSPGPPRPSVPFRRPGGRSVGPRLVRGLKAAYKPSRYAAHIRARLRPACRRRARGPPGRCAPPGGPPRLRWRAAFAPLRAPPLRPVGARRGPSLGRLAARVALAVPPAAAGWLGPFLLPRRASRSGCAALRLVPRRRCAAPSLRAGFAALRLRSSPSLRFPLPAGRRAALLAAPGAGVVLSSLGAAFRRALRRFAPCPRSSVARRCAAASPPPFYAPRRATFGGFLAPPQGRRGPPLRPSNRYKKSGVSPTPD